MSEDHDKPADRPQSSKTWGASEYAWRLDPSPCSVEDTQPVPKVSPDDLDTAECK